MKIGKKLVIGFMLIASLVGFVGIFSTISHNKIQTNSKIVTKVLELNTLLDESVVKLLALIQTETVEDYIGEKLDYEQIRAEFDALFKQLNTEHAKKLTDLGFKVEAFNEDARELAKISNSLIAIHKRCLAKNNVFKEKESLERQLRHKTIPALVALQDNALTRDADIMQYKSKEAIYQYKDQEHGVEWLEAISKIKDNSVVGPSQNVSKDLNAYERVAKDLCKIIVEQKTNVNQEHFVFGELKELINQLEENQAKVVDEIKAQSQALARNTRLLIFVVIAGAFLVSIVLGLTIAHSMSKPVANLAQTTQALAQGDFSVRVDVATADEIGELAASFNKMAEDLQTTTTSIDNLNQEIAEHKKTQEALQNSEQRYRSIFEQAADSIVLVDSKTGNLVEFNNKTCENLGYTREEFQKLRISNFEVIESAEEVSKHIEKIRKEGADVFETKHRKRDGKIRDILVSSKAITINGREFCQSIWSDITERKEAEQNLAKLNRELEITVEELTAANRELADYAHITAHDLKAPLRAIGGLAGMISSDYEDKLDEQGKEMLNMLVGRTERMSNQISSILRYSEIGRTEEKKDRTDLNLSLKKTISNINIPENVEITVENQLPTVICEKTRIVQVFQNLIDNAVKYIDKPQGQIRIGCVAEDGWWKFSVSDNGIGIEREYFEKIFQIFQTIVRRDEKEATGIGLSIVKKIIESHGGKIWVESKVGQGSTFFFTLAKQEMGVKNEKLQANTVS